MMEPVMLLISRQLPTWASRNWNQIPVDVYERTTTRMKVDAASVDIKGRRFRSAANHIVAEGNVAVTHHRTWRRLLIKLRVAGDSIQPSPVTILYKRHVNVKKNKQVLMFKRHKQGTEPTLSVLWSNLLWLLGHCLISPTCVCVCVL